MVKRIIYALIFLALVGIGWLVLFSADSGKLTSLDFPVVNNSSSEIVSSVRPKLQANEKDETQSDTQSYKYCRVALEELRDVPHDWFRANYESWEQYLEQGYSLDELTLAIEHFGNSNFAAEFRVNQLRKNSQLTQSTQTLYQQVRAIVPEVFDIPGLSVKAPVPARYLSELPSLPEKERQKILAEETVTVDDVAYFITEPNVSDAVIIEILAALVTPEDVVGYEKIESVSLLDYAVNAMRPDIVKALIRRGVLPNNNVYLGSTMDWALSNLYRHWNKPDREKAIQIVQLLQQQGAGAKFNVANQAQVSGQFPRRSFEFNNKQIDILLNHHGIDLFAIARITPLTVNEDSALFTMLGEERSVYVAAELGIDSPEEHKQQCLRTMKAIDDAWQAEPAFDVVKRVEAEHKGDVEQIEAFLADVDPMLIDIYRPLSHRYFRPIDPIANSNKYFNPLRNGDIHTVLKSFVPLAVTDGHKNWVFSQVLMWDSKYYSALVSAGFLAQEMQYFQYSAFRQLSIESLTTLAEAGADLYGVDAYGKPLLYYAAKQKDIALLKYMLAENFPYYSQGGEDPLHTALYPHHYWFSPEKVADVVSQLMAFKPDIDAYHLSRMAAVRLMYPDVYQKIVDNYPQLAVPPDTPLPKVK